MLIGIDASRAVSRAPTGTETYSRELTRALLALDQTNSYRLYTREPVARDFFVSPGESGRVEIRTIKFPRLWTHLRLSFEMLTASPDLLVVPAHVLPPIHPRRSIVTVHDLGHLHFPEAHPTLQRVYHTWTTQWNAQAATHVLADSEATRDDLVQFCRIPSEKISVVYPAYDARAYRPIRDSERLQETRDRFRIGRDYVLAIGTIHPRKNYGRLIEAFSQLSIDCDLIIVGKKGWLAADVFERVKSLGLDSRVRFLDYVPASEMPALVSGARLFVFPSLHEGFGLPILEAQACGTPVVCSMTSSLPEAAGDGALFIDPCDVNALAAAMERVLKDSALRSKIIANGFRNLERFSWEKSAGEVLRVIQSLE